VLNLPDRVSSKTVPKVENPPEVPPALQGTNASAAQLQNPTKVLNPIRNHSVAENGKEEATDEPPGAFLRMKTDSRDMIPARSRAARNLQFEEEG
jgi:hypothetical protein